MLGANIGTGNDGRWIMFFLEAVAGFIIGIAVVIGVFWLTFRRPPPRRRSDSTTAINSNSDAEYLIQHWRDDGQGGFGL